MLCINSIIEPFEHLSDSQRFQVYYVMRHEWRIRVLSLGECLVRHVATSSAPPQHLPALSLSSAPEPFFSPSTPFSHLTPFHHIKSHFQSVPLDSRSRLCEVPIPPPQLVLPPQPWVQVCSEDQEALCAFTHLAYIISIIYIHALY